MDTDTPKSARLLDFFRVMADEKRLQIVGLLARQNYSVEELATILNLSPATVSHHLGRLVQAGLVAARADQHYHVYSLQLQALREMAQQILSRERLQETADDLDLDAYDRKIMHDYVIDGRLKQIPTQRKKRDVILRHLATYFEPDRRYTEGEVNDIIGAFHEDYATLRRELIGGRWMARDHEIYWLVTA